MDSGNIIYLIAVIIYFIYTALKKRKPEQEVGGDQETIDPEQTQRRPASFDDLLKEIRSGQQEREKDLEHTGQRKPVRPVDQSKFDPRSIEKKTPEEKLEDVPFGRYEGFVSEKERPKHLTLDEQISLSASLTGLGVSEEGITLSKRVGKRTNRYAEMLKNPESVKDAVILSEILNRKEY